MPLLTLTDAALYYETGGAGPPAVYIHGGFVSLATTFYDDLDWSWEHDVATRFQFITYDRRGCYRSSVPLAGYDLATQAADLAALLDALGMDSAHIIGSSAGGPIALTFASRWPERVRSLALVGTVLELFPPDDPTSQIVRRHIAILEQEGPEIAFDHRPPEVEVTFQELWDHTEAAARGELDSYLARCKAWRARAQSQPRARRVEYYAAELRNLQAYIDQNLTSLARRLAVPALVLHGTNDQLVPLAWAETMAQTIPGVTRHIIPGGPHSLMIRDPRARQAALEWMLAADAGWPSRRYAGSGAQ